MSKLTKKSMKRMKLSKLVFIKGLREIIKQYSIRKRKELIQDFNLMQETIIQI